MTTPKVYRALVPIFKVVNAPALYPGDEVVPCVYIAGFTGDGHMATTQPIIVYISRDVGVTYEQVAVLGAHATMGQVVAVDGNPFTADGAMVVPSDANVAETWEGGVSLPILWSNGYSPISETEVRVLNGANSLLVGDEVLQFKTQAATFGSGLGATDNTAVGIYHHSDLLRGRRGTEGECANIDRGDDVIVIDKDSLIALPLLHSDIGSTLYFKAATPGLDLTDAIEHTIVFAARNMQPHAPSQVFGVRDASNNLTVNWSRRTRANIRLMGAKALPWGEERNDYVVEILSIAEPFAVWRTIEVTAGTSAVYTAAEQATDGYTAGNLVNLRVYQMSDSVGRGLAGDWRVPANAGGASTPTPNAKLYASRLD